jgi:hypothetical protein
VEEIKEEREKRSGLQHGLLEKMPHVVSFVPKKI